MDSVIGIQLFNWRINVTTIYYERCVDESLFIKDQYNIKQNSIM